MSNDFEDNNDSINVELPEDNATTNDDVVITSEVPPVKNMEFAEPYFDIKDDYKQKEITLHAPMERLTGNAVTAALMDFEKVLAESDTNPKLLESFKGIVSAMEGMLFTTFNGGEFDKTFDREDSDWTQRVTGDKDKKISISNPKFNLPSKTDRLEGLNAIRYLSSVTGVSAVTKVPLWHSGIVITLDAFKERRLLELHAQLVSHRMDLGADTKGAIFSGDDVYITMAIVNFILDHVTDCTLKDYNADNLKTVEVLKQNILVLDIPALLCGALSAIYPKGYPLFHQCVEVLKGKCTYTIDAEKSVELGDYKPDSLLDFRKVLWVDKSRLDQDDKHHMSAPNASHTFEEVKAYQKKVNRVQKFDSPVNIYGDENIKLSVKYKIPTLEEYEVSATAWCNKVTELVDKTIAIDNTLTENERLKRRNEILNQYAITLDLLKQVHWIDYISIVDQDNNVRTIEDANTINKTIEVFTELDGYNESYNSNLQVYKEYMAFALTGLPNFICPVCKNGQTEQGSKYPSLIPMNMVSYFFILMVWRNLIKYSELRM